MFSIYRSLGEIPAVFGPSAITVGNFDGVHLGHSRILREVAQIGREHGWATLALTFDPHPTKVVAPDRMPRLLTSMPARLALFAQAGLQAALVLPFTPEVARLAPEEFVEKILVEKLRAQAVVVGANFRFGRNHAGDAALLGACGRRFGFEVRIIDPVIWRGKIVSSSAVRQLISAGAVSQAAHMLGRPFAVEGRVVRGHGVGARQTVPTLNLAPETEVLPERGVYSTCTTDPDSGREWPSVTNIGYRPTFGGSDLSIETFLLRPLDGPSPVRLSIAFWRRLRDEKKFASPDELRAQIWKDVAATEKFFRRLRAAQKTTIAKEVVS
ncbi:MAG TPA: bifunctional riboflavin kinase/FAD synthetase [Bryobacterales bacterium]|nr:bifunctional riboflavin kinase/FAD synthetase [Bryobacterales bacterium]